MNEAGATLGQKILSTVESSLSTNSDFVVLKSTTPVAKWKNEDVKMLLMALRSSSKRGTPDEKLNAKLYGLLLNSALTQARLVFMTSYRSFNQMLAKQKDIRRKTCSSAEYKTFTSWLLITRQIEQLKPPGKPNKAGVYRFANCDVKALFASLHPEETEAEQIKQCIDLYEGKGISSRETSLRSSQEGENVFEPKVESALVSVEELKKVIPSTERTNRNFNALEKSLPSSLAVSTEALAVSSIPLLDKIEYSLSWANLDDKRVTMFKNLFQMISEGKPLSEKQIQIVNERFVRARRDLRMRMVDTCYEHAKEIDVRLGTSLNKEIQNADCEFIFDIVMLFQKAVEEEARNSLLERLDTYQKAKKFGHRTFVALFFMILATLEDRCTTTVLDSIEKHILRSKEEQSL